MWSWLSCEKYTETSSRMLDEKISHLDRMGYLIHHALCFNCRRFTRQIKLIENALKGVINSEPAASTLVSESDLRVETGRVKTGALEMTDDSKQRIKLAMEQALTNRTNKA